jgi:hypothetical protein
VLRRRGVEHEWVEHEWVEHEWVEHEWVEHEWVEHEWVEHEWVGGRGRLIQCIAAHDYVFPLEIGHLGPSRCGSCGLELSWLRFAVGWLIKSLE